MKARSFNCNKDLPMNDENLIVADLEYNSYLNIAELLDLQKPLSTRHGIDGNFYDQTGAL